MSAAHLASRSSHPALAWRATLLLVLGGCNNLFSVPDIAGGHLQEIEVTTDAVVEVGDTVRLTALGTVDGVLGLLDYDPLNDAVWGVSDTALARLERLPPPAPADSYPMAHVLVRGRHAGRVTVTASARGVTGGAVVTIIPPIARLEIELPRAIVRVGDTVSVPVRAVSATGDTVPDLPLASETEGGIQAYVLRSTAVDLVRLTATDTGEAVLTVRFRRVAARAALRVQPGLP